MGLPARPAAIQARSYSRRFPQGLVTSLYSFDTWLTSCIGALGAAATKPCKYSFPIKTVGEALGLSRVLESVGVSAYL